MRKKSKNQQRISWKQNTKYHIKKKTTKPRSTGYRDCLSIKKKILAPGRRDA